MVFNWLIPIGGFAAMIGLSIMFSSGQNSYESEEHDLVVAGFEDLLVECNNIYDYDSQDSYIDNFNFLIEEYGEFNKLEDDFELVSGNSEVMILMDNLTQCENEKGMKLITYESEEHDLVVAELEDLLVECNNSDDYYSYNSYINHFNSFINEYGEFNNFSGGFEFTSPDSKINAMLDNLDQCDVEVELRLIADGEIEG